MIRRAAAAAIVLALALGMTTACQPDPAPSASGPIFANEEEAFAAAEETYRAYVDALNQVDLSDPETFEAVYAWTTGDFNAGERTTLSKMHAEAWTVSGESEITRIDHLVAGESFMDVMLGSCVDVSSVVLLDAEGVSKVAPDRPDMQMTEVDLQWSESSPTGYLISEVAGAELEPSCLP